MFPPSRRNRQRPPSWLSPFYSMWDSVTDFWWRLRKNTSKLFDFRWLSMRLSGFVQYAWWAVRYPFYIIGWLLQQLWSVLVAWWQIRNFRYLIQGLPALAAIIFIIIVSAYTFLRADDGLQELYVRQANDAKMRADKQKARLCLERLMQLQYVGDPRRLETQFDLGKLAEELGQKQRSRSLLSELANPDNDEGFAAAHLERAKMIYYNQKRQKDDLTLVEKHLRRALKKQPENKEVNAFMGLLLADQGRMDEAITFLLKSHPNDVGARLALGRIYKLQGNHQQAQLYIEPVIAFLKSHASGEIDDISYRLRLADAHMQLDEFDDAIKALETGYSLKKSDFFRMALSNCYTNWYKRLMPMPVTPERERLKLECLVKALDWDNTNVQAINLMVYYMGNSGTDLQQRDHAHRLLMAQRGSNPYLHMWLGDKLRIEGKIEECAKEWDLAFKLNPNSSILANNFAWILTQGSESPVRLQPDLMKAERIINEVLSRTSREDKNYPWYLGTRGTIYLKMGRYEEARADLVAATQRPGSDNDFNLHKQLIEVYDRLRMPTMADNHRKLLTEAIKRNKSAEAGTQ